MAWKRYRNHKRPYKSYRRYGQYRGRFQRRRSLSGAAWSAGRRISRGAVDVAGGAVGAAGYITGRGVGGLIRGLLHRGGFGIKRRAKRWGRRF